MKRALLIGVADEHPDQCFRPGPSLASIESLLGDLGDWTISRVEGRSANRAGILAALAGLEAKVGPSDTCLFYFAGHGGIVEISDAAPPLGGRPVFYITAARPGHEWSFEAVTDIELSLCLARIDEVCRNVTAILDCCYSARLVRGPMWPLSDSPDWLRDLAGRLANVDTDDLTDPTSHPRIVRVAASSSLRRTFPQTRTDGHLGRLTQLFVEVVREADLQIDHLTWDAVVHRIREQAIWSLGCEDQWVSLAGPRQRLVFARDEVVLPRTVGFIPREQGIGGWIRAGELQGVQVGDEWGLAELVLDDELQPHWRGRMRVVATDLNRAELQPINGDTSAKPGTSAQLLSARRRAAICIKGPAMLATAVARSAWLAPIVGDTNAPAPVDALSVRGQTLETHSAGDQFAPACFAHDDRGLAGAIDRLEDWARARLLLAVAGSRGVADTGPVTVSWGRYQPRGRRQVSDDLTKAAYQQLHVGDRIYLRVTHTSGRGEWFVSAIEIDVAGRPALLDASEPDGRELLSGETAVIGWHAHRHQQGLELTWPERTSTARPGPVTIIILMSQRPIQLGHLVRGIRDDQLPRDTPRPRRARTRGHLTQPRPRTGPELAHDWAATLIRYELDPRPRPP